MIRALAFLVLISSSGVNAQDVKPVKDAGPYVPSPQSVVADMLRYAEVGPTDFADEFGIPADDELVARP